MSRGFYGRSCHNSLFGTSFDTGCAAQISHFGHHGWLLEMFYVYPNYWMMPFRKKIPPWQYRIPDTSGRHRHFHPLLCSSHDAYLSEIVFSVWWSMDDDVQHEFWRWNTVIFLIACTVLYIFQIVPVKVLGSFLFHDPARMMCTRSQAVSPNCAPSGPNHQQKAGRRNSKISRTWHLRQLQSRYRLSR